MNADEVKEVMSKEKRGILQLSILVPTIPSRRKIFTRLMDELYRQIQTCKDYHPTLGEVEVIWDRSKTFLTGGPSIGEKCQKLLNRAQGCYLCYLHDDDWISPNYVETLLRLCYEDKDVCSFRNISKFDGYWCIVDLSMSNPNEQTRDNEMVLRQPWHICPVKSEYAKQCKFPNKNYGEDWDWMGQVLIHCKTEAKTKAVVHEYHHSVKKSEADKITQHEQDTTGHS